MTESDGTVRKKGWLGRLFGSGAPQDVKSVDTPETPASSQDFAPNEDIQPTTAEPVGWGQKLRDGLKNSSHKLSQGISQIFSQKPLDAQTLDDLQDILIMADMGVETSAFLVKSLAKKRFDKNVSPEDVRGALAEDIEHLLEPVAHPLTVPSSDTPYVILVVGVNGVGKTTTIGKVASCLRQQGLSVMLAAGDTFRAAATEQLKIWGERTGCPVITCDHGADAAGLAFDALQAAQTQKSDVLLIDTAGRLHTKKDLMEELKKIRRVLDKACPGAPHKTLLVLDATSGQNAHQQLDVFQKEAQVDSLVLTKLDGTAKGGILVSLAQKYGLPVHYVGVGEHETDLNPFTASDFARGLMDLS